MSDEVDNFLEHVGVKGMKWGVKRSGKSGKKSGKAKSTTVSRIKDNVKKMPKKELGKRIAAASLVSAGTIASIAIMTRVGKTPARSVDTGGLSAMIYNKGQAFTKVSMSSPTLLSSLRNSL